MILNLANRDNGDIKYKLLEFPDGDKHIDLQEGLPFLQHTNTLSIKVRLLSLNDVFILKQAVHILRGYKESLILNLDIVYMLGARYDREMHENDVCSLAIICDDINALNFRSIRVLEPHSAATTLLLKRSKGYSMIDSVAASHVHNCVAAPDLGAVKRVHEFIKKSIPVTGGLKVILTDKDRVISTGEIKGVKIFNPSDIEEYVLIYDDLCDGGRTFIELAKELRKHGAKHITLAITHGIFSKGLDVLFNKVDDGGYVDHIITTNSFSQHMSTNALTVIQVI